MVTVKVLRVVVILLCLYISTIMVNKYKYINIYMVKESEYVLVNKFRIFIGLMLNNHFGDYLNIAF